MSRAKKIAPGTVKAPGATAHDFRVLAPGGRSGERPPPPLGDQAPLLTFAQAVFFVPGVLIFV